MISRSEGRRHTMTEEGIVRVHCGRKRGGIIEVEAGRGGERDECVEARGIMKICVWFLLC